MVFIKLKIIKDGLDTTFSNPIPILSKKATSSIFMIMIKWAYICYIPITIFLLCTPDLHHFRINVGEGNKKIDTIGGIATFYKAHD